MQRLTFQDLMQRTMTGEETFYPAQDVDILLNEMRVFLQLHHDIGARLRSEHGWTEAERLRHQRDVNDRQGLEQILRGALRVDASHD